MKARPVADEERDAMRAIAGDFAVTQGSGFPQLLAFAGGAPYDTEKLHGECLDALYRGFPAGQEGVDMRERLSRLERFARAEKTRAMYRYRLRVAVEGLAEWGEPLEAIQAAIEPAFGRGARHRR